MVSGECLKVLGAHVQLDGGHATEFRYTLAAAWASHSKRPFWRETGSSKHKLQALHLSVYPCLAWCCGSRHWMATELRAVCTAQLRMTRRICGWWPQTDETFPAYAKRAARWAEKLWLDGRHASRSGGAGLR